MAAGHAARVEKVQRPLRTIDVVVAGAEASKCNLPAAGSVGEFACSPCYSIVDRNIASARGAVMRREGRRHTIPARVRERRCPTHALAKPVKKYETYFSLLGAGAEKRRCAVSVEFKARPLGRSAIVIRISSGIAGSKTAARFRRSLF